MGVPGAGIFSWLMGAVGDRYGLKGAILVVPATLIIFIAIIICECWIRKDKNFPKVR
jgi:fucose permease